MEAPEPFKRLFASLPVPGWRRLIITHNACSAFGNGAREMIISGLRACHQCYVVPSTQANALKTPEFEKCLSGVEIDKKLHELPSDAVCYPACIELECQIQDLDTTDDFHRVVLSKWIERVQFLYHRLSSQISQIRPHAIIFFQGYLPEAAVLRCLARQREIPFLSVERTAFNGRLCWDHISGLSVGRNIARNDFWRNGDSVNDDEARTFAHDYLASIDDSKREEHQSPKERYLFPPRSERGLRIVYLGQVYTDSSILFGQISDLDPLSTIETVARYAAENDHHLMVKLHPKEKGGASPIGTNYQSLTMRKLRAAGHIGSHSGGIPENQIDDSNAWSTLRLMEDADVVITQSSQAGIEAALLGKPVILCGESFYRGFGWTIDVRDKRDLISVLGGFANEMKSPYQTQIEAAKFFYSFFHHYTRPPVPSALFSLLKNHIY